MLRGYGLGHRISSLQCRGSCLMSRQCSRGMDLTTDSLCCTVEGVLLIVPLPSALYLHSGLSCPVGGRLTLRGFWAQQPSRISSLVLTLGRAVGLDQISTLTQLWLLVASAMLSFLMPSSNQPGFMSKLIEIVSFRPAALLFCEKVLQQNPTLAQGLSYD